MVKRSLCSRHKSHGFQHLSGVRPTPQRQKRSHSLRCTMCLNEKRLKMTSDKGCTNSCIKGNSFMDPGMPNGSTGLIAEAELCMGSRAMWERITCPPFLNDWRRFINADAVWNDLRSIGCHNQVDGLIYCCIRSRWFTNSPTGEPVE